MLGLGLGYFYGLFRLVKLKNYLQFFKEDSTLRKSNKLKYLIVLCKIVRLIKKRNN